jgi:hypothetical protein
MDEFCGVKEMTIADERIDDTLDPGHAYLVLLS